MKKNLKKIIALVFMFALVCTCFTGCRRPYDKPEFVTITPSQTAFLVPLVGDSSNQAAFESEEMLLEHKVATKEIQIPHRWVQTGRRNWMGEWKPSATLIIVERKPVARSWESGDSTATSNNKAIFGETSDGIGIYVGMNCSAQIEEKDAAKFLYRYNNTPLETIIDTDIKKKVEDEFNMVTSVYTSTELHTHKADIMAVVKENVISHFKEYGITITVLGIKEGFSFENPDIQAAIDAKFASEQDLIIQQNKNEANLAKAEAEAEAKIIAAEADAQKQLIEAEARAEATKKEADAKAYAGEKEAEANNKIKESITDDLLKYKEIEQWSGNLPTYVGNGNEIPIIGVDK
jgi:regulator of protease activity HflC (stomatin/prohibitin superfamily)